MLLIDAIYINTGGGKILLDYLIEELEKTDKQIFYLLDKRIQKEKYVIKSTNVILYLKSGFFDRMNFYKKNKNRFSKVFCFGNIPPPIKLKSDVLTYFQNINYISYSKKDFSLKNRFISFLKRKILSLWKNNTDKWIVQSLYVQQKMIEKYGENKNKIEIIPFFKSIKKNRAIDNIGKISNSFLYVSNAYPNKNHIRLIEAFCNFYDKYKIGKLTLTVSEKFDEVKKLIDSKIQQEYPIENLGYVSQDILIKSYIQSEFVIFPSTSESFGLGLIEGIEFECKIISADLPYTYAVCEPSIVFNPLSIESIEKSFDLAIHNNVKNSILKTKNSISKLINLLKS
ncbi:glycosyltransferase [Capnocytophaga sputigena]|uniref:glycosyltransferase n=1 Tax=Capnocytophaga sputigena TaxID=1019 RepID=UPI00288C3C99|nr:glycosyltransferase [Capnocytophaga sputigena]